MPAYAYILSESQAERNAYLLSINIPNYKFIFQYMYALA